MKLGEVFETIVGPDAPVEFVAFDGSKAGTPGADVRIAIPRQRGVDLMLSSPGQIGLARAYVAGEIEIDGDIVAMLDSLYGIKYRAPWSARLRLAKDLAPDLFRRVDFLRRSSAPPEEKRLGGRRHSKSRDAEAIAHHYDVSNAFYRYVLGPSMAYTCAVFPTTDASLEVAQDEKFDLVCRKLDLRPGMRLLDVGCGWGGMVSHAVKNYGVTAIGVTLSKAQAEWGQQAIVDAGLASQAEVRFGDYRDVQESGFDAVSSIGLTEHIGEANYPAYFRFLRSKAMPGARILNHSITRPHDKNRVRAGAFIDRYIFPDGELTGPAKIVSALTAEGWELRHEENIREHYAMTLHKWRENLEANWDAAVAEVGIRKARVWRLYMAVSEFGFEHNFIELHQFLATNTTKDGQSGMPLRPDFGRTG